MVTSERQSPSVGSFAWRRCCSIGSSVVGETATRTCPFTTSSETLWTTTLFTLMALTFPSRTLRRPSCSRSACPLLTAITRSRMPKQKKVSPPVRSVLTLIPLLLPSTVYTNDKFIPKNTSVLVARIPLEQKQRRNYNDKPDPNMLASVSSLPPDNCSCVNPDDLFFAFNSRSRPATNMLTLTTSPARLTFRDSKRKRKLFVQLYRSPP